MHQSESLRAFVGPEKAGLMGRIQRVRLTQTNLNNGIPLALWKGHPQ